MCESDRETDRHTGTIGGLRFEENNLARACASLALAVVNLLCERVGCSAEDILFPLACCCVLESVFSLSFFPLHLHTLDSFHGKQTQHSCHGVSFVLAWTSVRMFGMTTYLKAEEQKCTGGLSGLCWWQSGNWRPDFCGQRGDVVSRTDRRLSSLHLLPPMAQNLESLHSRCYPEVNVLYQY